MSTKRGTIIIVDDEPGVIEIVEANLEPKGYRVLSANTGQEALEKIRKAKPDLVVLDVMMPEMDGWEVLRRIEQDPKTAGLPVIMLTVKSGDEDILRALEAGAVEYITKPFYPQDVVARVEIMLDVFDATMRDHYRQGMIAKRKRFLEHKVESAKKT